MSVDKEEAVRKALKEALHMVLDDCVDIGDGVAKRVRERIQDEMSTTLGRLFKREVSIILNINAGDGPGLFALNVLVREKTDFLI